jgi:hypothetical protein
MLNKGGIHRPYFLCHITDYIVTTAEQFGVS